MRQHLVSCFASLFVFSCTQVQASCYKEAAERYRVPEALLRAVAHVESGGLPAHKAFNKNKGGTQDMGRMQINSGWLPTLKKYGITADDLLNECTSINVGAWIMANNVRVLGMSWDAVGAYNVGCKKLSRHECETRRNRYAWKVYRALNTKPGKSVMDKTEVTAGPYVYQAQKAQVQAKAQIGTVSFE